MSSKAYVLDTNTFIRGLDFRKLKGTFYTTPTVVAEIKDSASLSRWKLNQQFVNVLPPTQASIEIIRKFATITGDSHNLSIPDIQVIALAYDLCSKAKVTHFLRDKPLPVKENDDKEHKERVKAKKDKKKAIVKIFTQTQTKEDEDEWNISVPKSEADLIKDLKFASTAEERGQLQSTIEKYHNFKQQSQIVPTEKSAEKNDEKIEEEAPDEEDDAAAEDEELSGEEDKNAKQIENDDDDYYTESEEEVDDGEGQWINPDNICAVLNNATKAAIGNEIVNSIPVRIATTDYSMQNVILQIGIPLYSIQGYQINTIAKFVLRCRACKEIMKKNDIEFCNKCGNHTLSKVSVHTGMDGSVSYSTTKRNPNIRGTVFSIPNPKDGRNANNVILREDELIEKRKKAERSMKKKDLREQAEDFFEGKESLRAQYAKDTVRFGIRGNPNQKRK